MNSDSIDRDAIIRILADRLPDPVLKETFPEIPPTTVRNILLEKQEPAGPQSRQQNLFTTPLTGGALCCKLFTDGASRGNPGEAGAGIVLLDDDNNELAVRSLYLGRCTNNTAEYKALLLGLETALQMGCKQLDIFMDSQLIVRQVQGLYKVKNAGLKPLFDKCRTLLAEFDKYSIEHVHSARNKRADELANQGIDEKTEAEN